MWILIGVVLCVGIVKGQSEEAPKKIRVAGSVRNAAGALVSKATIRLGDYTELTNDSGTFAFEDVAPGVYSLSAAKAGYVTQHSGARSAGAPGTPLKLEAGQELKDLSIQLIAQGVLSGHVSDRDGDAVPRADVYIERYSYVLGRKQLVSAGLSSANDQGDFRIPNLSPGRYYLSAVDWRGLTSSQRRAPLQEGNLQTYYPNGEGPADATPLDVQSGVELRGIGIQLRRGQLYSIRGKVAHTSGVSLAGVRVGLAKVMSGGLTSRADQSTNDDGAFEFTKLVPGKYVLQALMEGARTQDGGTATSTFKAHMEVMIAASSLDGLVLKLAPGSEITGILKLEDGDLKVLMRPVLSSLTPAPPLVELQGPLSKLQMAAANRQMVAVGGSRSLSISLTSAGVSLFGMSPIQVNDDGVFRFQGAEANTFAWSVAGLSDDTYVKSASFGTKDVTRSPIELTGSGSLMIVLSSKAGIVRGALHNDKGEPMGGYSVTLWPRIPDLGSGSGSIQQATTDQTGAIKFSSLAPGDYFVAAWEDLDLGLAQSSEFLAHFNSDATKLTLGESEKTMMVVKLIPLEKIAAEITKLP